MIVQLDPLTGARLLQSSARDPGRSPIGPDGYPVLLQLPLR